MSQTKDYRQEVLSGGMDTRNPDGNVSPDSYRLLVNVDGSDSRRIGRLPGWRKYGADQSCFNNRDLHDQLIGAQTYQESSTTAGTTFCTGPELTRANLCKESVTLLHSVSSPTGARRLMAGTKTRLYVNDDYGGNWRLLADGMGGCFQDDEDCICAPTRFKAATLGDETFLANNVDPVLVWQFDSAVEGCNQRAAQYVYELLSLGIETAELVIEFKGFILIANVIQDGIRYKNRIFWSDFNAGSSWIPGGESLAGFTDLGASEEILNWAIIGGKLRVYTNKAIYDGQLVGDSQLAQAGLVFAFTEVYRGTALPVYRNTLIRAGANHYFMGESTIYRMAEYDTSPTEFPWIRFASGAVFNGIPSEWVDGAGELFDTEPINPEMCDNAVAGWREKDGSVWFSYPITEGKCPFVTLVIWPDTLKATIIDHGFTAFVQHTPSTRTPWRDYLADAGICDPEETLAEKEGSPCGAGFSSAGFTYLWNETEDASLPMGGNAAFSSFCGVCLADLCRSCETDVKFVMASSTDVCLKEYNESIFYRERYTGMTSATFPRTGTATYVQDGYTTLIRSDASSLKSARTKTARKMKAAYKAQPQFPASRMRCDVFGGEDPGCMQIEVGDDQALQCVAGDDHFRPNSYLSYSFYTTGVFLAWQLWVEGVGGQFSLTTTEFRVIHDER